MSIPMTPRRTEESARQRRGVACRLLDLSCAALAGLNRGLGLILNRLQLLRGVRYWYRPRPDDVFVVSFPKSGTTLMQMMLYQLTTSGEMDFPHIDSVSPSFEPNARHGNPQTLELVPSPRIFKSHLRYELLPRGARYIYLARDVRDVAVSAYYHSRLVGGLDLDLSWYLDRFLAGQTIFGSWFEHLESWWPHRNDADVLFLRFEEVVADLEGTVRRVAEFCGFEIREEEMPRILERCSLDFMKRHEEKFDPRLRRVARQRVAFIRDGKARAGRDILNPAQKQLLASKLAVLERKLGVSAQDPKADLLRPSPRRLSTDCLPSGGHERAGRQLHRGERRAVADRSHP
ncbi:MAG TPA: sulfotransferase domain-containing protein [Thermoanaerobaculia bacterium]|jgi:hypothetical protein